MNIVNEANISGKPLTEKPRRPIRMLRWFVIVGTVLAVVVGGLVGFNYLRSQGIKQFFASNKPPPASVTVAEAKSEVIPNLLSAVGDLAAVHQVNVTSDVSGRVTDIMFTGGAPLDGRTPPPASSRSDRPCASGLILIATGYWKARSTRSNLRSPLKRETSVYRRHWTTPITSSSPECSRPRPSCFRRSRRLSRCRKRRSITHSMEIRFSSLPRRKRTAATPACLPFALSCVP